MRDSVGSNFGLTERCYDGGRVLDFEVLGEVQLCYGPCREVSTS